MERNVFDLVARAFIAAFYEDCKFETTTVLAEVNGKEDTNVMFRTSGKVITDEGWHVVFKKATEKTAENSMEKTIENATEKAIEGSEEATGNESASLPVFNKGEEGPHSLRNGLSLQSRILKQPFFEQWKRQENSLKTRLCEWH